jgi:hypothetical protein
MKKYKITLTKEFFVKALDETQAEDKVIEMCAEDSEILNLLHSMECTTVEDTDSPDYLFE